MKKLPAILKTLLFAAFLAGPMAMNASAQNLRPAAITDVVTNDANIPNSASIYQYTSGTLFQIPGSPFSTRSNDFENFFAATTVVVVPGATNCVYVSDALGAGKNSIGDIAVFQYSGPIATLVQRFVSTGMLSSTEGLGLAVSGGFLYANYTGSGMIEALKMNSATCKLTDTGHGATGRDPAGNPVDGMAAKGRCLVAAYADGYVGSYTVGAGNIALVGQTLTNGGNEAVAVTVTKDDYALFDDLAGTAQFDAFKIAAGCTLGADVSSGPLTGSINGSDTFLLAPNGATLYTIGTFSGTIQTDKYMGAGVVANTTCADVTMNGWQTNFAYPGQAITASTTASGGALLVAEAGYNIVEGSSSSFIGEFPVANGCLTSTGQSQTEDPNSPFMLSLAGVP